MTFAFGELPPGCAAVHHYETAAAERLVIYSTSREINSGFVSQCAGPQQHSPARVAADARVGATARRHARYRGGAARSANTGAASCGGRSLPSERNDESGREKPSCGVLVDPSGGAEPAIGAWRAHAEGAHGLVSQSQLARNIWRFGWRLVHSRKLRTKRKTFRRRERPRASQPARERRSGCEVGVCPQLRLERPNKLAERHFRRRTTASARDDVGRGRATRAVEVLLRCPDLDPDERRGAADLAIDRARLETAGAPSGAPQAPRTAARAPQRSARGAKSAQGVASPVCSTRFASTGR